MPTEWLSRKRISCLCWKITRNLRHTPAPTDQRTKQKHGFPAVKMWLSQWNNSILQPMSTKCQRMCLKCRRDSLCDTGPLQQMMRGQEEHCCPKQRTTQLRPVTESRHTESIRKQWNNMGTTLLFYFLSLCLIRITGCDSRDWARCPRRLLPALCHVRHSSCPAMAASLTEGITLTLWMSAWVSRSVSFHFLS